MSDSEAPMSLRRDSFELEILKLLLQVVWADEDVSAEEAEQLIDRARTMGLTEAHLDELGTYVRGEAPLPAPNLGLLKARRADVMREIRALLKGHRLNTEESDILDEITMLLS